MLFCVIIPPELGKMNYPKRLAIVRWGARQPNRLGAVLGS